ncbi:hypothetical protein DB43_FS00090 [Parachlamydia acanthamoebae]|uniref:Uncharacterized protein n=1 Tax=Parachlamydia acanthamoebae TaxID=83552 RepID=A0A0C1ECI5_9BACT|nr:hypothetical protein DB43_FS00090 [Parachlamydia acanthamoebae]
MHRMEPAVYDIIWTQQTLIEIIEKIDVFCEPRRLPQFNQ